MKTSLAKVLIMFGFLMLSGCSANQLSQTEEMHSDRELAQLALDSGRPDSAISIYRKQLDLQPNDTELLLAIGTAYNQMSEFDLALHYLNQVHALMLSETNKSSLMFGQILRERGNAQQGLGNLEEAILDLQKAAKLLPKDAKALNSLGINYALFKDYPQARIAFTSALAHAPDNLEYRNNLALAWILDGQPQQGIDVLYSHYLRGSSTSKSRQNLALAFALKGDVDAAETIAKQDLTKAELENNLTYYQQLYQGQLQQELLSTEQVKQ
ncbi:tetratricopeptide repeat protein [Moritella marina ATCC 15381]|uniref:Tetratricopeptide repeat protein n=1 Tax=Moritella marina ATCC 15381 TaxID=1202962 RepID=A0A5J6WLB3_MORMI|nr:tetratricopeptide repeat protein [Moritella marina]QFI38021.1 tetratricopeptide repeat protein [Moritella marina ATCC 15381]